ncbi:flavin-containing monooxygenase [Aeromicrobium sp. CTD01-1L150]|uniref:flavin-containing monooxygenase n=1 Tax=Aeromicrobium sp. CTD01-1L150 TaxID=3341830 RepID=UPI0035BF2361
MDPDVIVIGAGMAGLAATRYLQSEGFSVRTLEAHSDLGGQWNRTNPRSGVWPQMRTNTAAFLTRLSDVTYPDSTAVFPRNDEVLATLHDYARRTGIESALTFDAYVTAVMIDSEGYRVQWTHHGRERETMVGRVVVATGRYNCPAAPPIPDLDRFEGVGGLTHAFDYEGPQQFDGMRVIVCGGSISALEIAGDLAMGRAREVHLAQRRQRFVMPKMVTGTPIESFVFTRAEAQALVGASAESVRAATTDRVLHLAGNPRDYGAPEPHPDVALAGIAGSPHYLNLVAEDRLSIHPWIRAVEGDTITFTDGTQAGVDAIVAATGFALDLPFLDHRIQEVVGCDRETLELADFTFHPELPGLAFAGLWPQLGPYAVPLEQQARWIAYSWSGRIPPPTEEALRQGVRLAACEQHQHGYREQHEMALRFARLAGVDPDTNHDPFLREILPRSAMTADVFRITGPDADPDARQRVIDDFWRYAAPAAHREVFEVVDADGTDQCP